MRHLPPPSKACVEDAMRELMQVSHWKDRPYVILRLAVLIERHAALECAVQDMVRYVRLDSTDLAAQARADQCETLLR